jgi:hypothetical protein
MEFESETMAMTQPIFEECAKGHPLLPVPGRRSDRRTLMNFLSLSLTDIPRLSGLRLPLVGQQRPNGLKNLRK